MRVVGHLQVYNSGVFLPLVLSHVHEHLDELIIIDGAWRPYLALGFYEKAWSTDNSEKILEDLEIKCPYKWIPSPRTGWESHAAKCAEFLKYLNLGDWQFYMNDDEILVGDVEGFFKELRADKKHEAVNVILYDWKLRRDNRVVSCARFFRFENGVHYGYSHVDLLNKDGVVFREWVRRETKKVTFGHLRELKIPHMRSRIVKFNEYVDTHVRGSPETLQKLLVEAQ